MWGSSLGSVCIKVQASTPKAMAAGASALREALPSLPRQPGMGVMLFGSLSSQTKSLQAALPCWGQTPALVAFGCLDMAYFLY